MRQPQVDVAVLGERAEHRERVGVQPGRPEDADPLGQVGQRGVGAQCRALGVQPLGGAGAEPVAQPPPQLRLPGEVGGQRVVPVGVRGPPPSRAASAAGARRRSGTARRGAPRRPTGGRGGGRRRRARGAGRAPCTTARRGCRRPPRAAATPGSPTGRRAGRSRARRPAPRSTILPADGNTTPEQIPSRADPAPSTVESRCASHRSTPFAGTATTSDANGSASGVARTAARPSARRAVRSARWARSTRPVYLTGPTEP